MHLLASSRRTARVCRGDRGADAHQRTLPTPLRVRPRRAPPSSAAASDAAATPPPSSAESKWAYTSPVHRVRDYELDMFNVVNNALYGHLFQDARHLALEKICGRSVSDYLEAGVLMALSELIIRYKSPLRSGDHYVSRVAVADVKGTRVTLAQEVVRVEADGCEIALAADGSATVVFLGPSYRPARMPAEAREAFEAALVSQCKTED
jgi:acyl-CoA thioesterase FadM